MPKQLIRGLTTALAQEFATPQVFALHEPALAVLLELALGQFDMAAGDAEKLQLITTKLGMASSDPPSTQMVGSVAVLPIFGVLSQKSNWMTRYLGWTSTETLERDFKEAANNSQVKAIVLYCDSPGGNAMGNEEVSRAIFQARGSKPIVGYVRGMCASAGYYLTAAASKVFASPSSLIGSIGAVSTHLEYSKALAEAGIGVNVIRSAPHKQLWNQFEKLGVEGKATLQKMVSDYGGQFEAAVARYRGVGQDVVKAKFGQGDAFVAPEARERGLIDGVVSWETLLAKLQSGGPLPNLSGDDGADEPVTRKQFSFAAGNLLPGWSQSLEAEYARAAGERVEGLHGADFFAPAIAASAASPLLSPPAGSALPAAMGTADGGIQQTSPEKSNVKISAKVRAALFARNLIQAQDADEAVCLAARDAYFAARGEACPQEDEKVCAALFASHAVPAGAGAPAPAAAPPANNVQQAHEREVAEARSGDQAAAERKRYRDIRASAKMLGMDEAAIDAAIDGGKPFAEVVAAWHEQLANKEKPVTQRTDVKVGEDGAAKYVADASLAIMVRNEVPGIPAEKITPQIRQLAEAPLYVHAAECLRMANIRHDPYDREAIAEAALNMDGSRQLIRADVAAPAYNRPGSFPNLLSNLAGKILDQGVEMAETTYDRFMGMWPGDLPDFKPAPVVSKSTTGEMDELLDSEEFKEQGLAEECLSAMQLARYGNKVGLTPVLVANDDLGAFTEDLLGLADGWEMTKNRLGVRLLTANPTLLDTFALFDNTNHGNLPASGAAPSTAQWDAMTQKLAAQKTVGGKAYMRARLSVALVPPQLETVAYQTFAPFRDLPETKVPTTASGLDIFRGRVEVVSEPELQAFSAVVWYGLTSPKKFRNAALVMAFFRGWGKQGRRERWYDPNTKCYWISLEGRVGVAAKNYRTIVKNPGQ